MTILLPARPGMVFVASLVSLVKGFAVANVNVAAFVVSTSIGLDIDSLRIAFLSTGRRDLPSGLGVALPL